MKTVVVTGASTKIGWGCTKVLIQNDFRVFGSVRKQADREILSSEFGPNFVPLLFDVTDEAAREGCCGAGRGGTCRGDPVRPRRQCRVAISGPLLYFKLDNVRRQLEVNVVGQLAVTQAFAPLLGTDRSRTRCRSFGQHFGVPGTLPLVQLRCVGSITGRGATGGFWSCRAALQTQRSRLSITSVCAGEEKGPFPHVAAEPLARPVTDFRDFRRQILIANQPSHTAVGFRSRSAPAWDWGSASPRRPPRPCP